ncbi:glycosyltransferase [Streptomyces sp. NPDC088387]|uniref:glycosyltransferase n=1 Tax=Streptomyces sp. NPDC088387 TaxID=3365859 RepID=UPI0037FD3F7C
MRGPVNSPALPGSPADPVPLTVQSWPFTGPDDGVPQDLYAAVLTGSVRRSRGALHLEEATHVTGDTYFGRFPASYWQRWTDVRQVHVRLAAEGAGLVRLLAGDVDGEARTVDTVRVDGTQDVQLTAALDRFVDGGHLWLDARTGPGGRLSLRDARWDAATGRPARRTTAVICTTDRVQDCLRTLTAIGEDPRPRALLAGVTVVDHGHDRVDAHPGFPRVAALLGGRLRHLAQPNLGGAGGFTRGLYETRRAAEAGGDVLFMDDDVVLEPDLILRMVQFTRCTHAPLILGGQMLNLLHPSRLHAGAEHTDLDGIRPGVPAPHSAHAQDLITPARDTGRPARQDRRVEAGYNGWWACLVPADVVDAIGYPLPLFFQGDDAEFSYRAKGHGFPTVTLPGAGLWHTDFPWKDDDEINRYFIVRNYTIISALHGSFDRGRLTRVLATELLQSLLGHQYGRAATVLRAVDDFLRGPAVLDDGGASTLVALRRLRAAFPETVCQDFTALAAQGRHDLAITVAGRPPRWWPAAGLVRLGAALLGRHRHRTGSVPHDEAHWWHIARFRTAAVTDASQRGVRLRSWDRGKLAGLARRSLTTLLRLWLRGPRVRAQFRAALPRLSARENWDRIYALAPGPAAAASPSAPAEDHTPAPV